MNAKPKMLVYKIASLLLVCALALAITPVASVSAAGMVAPPPPESENSRISNARIENAWVRLQEVYARQGEWLDRADALVDRIQELIDRMEDNGKDTAALQAALDAFERELKNAHPVYESAKGIINAHKGFDADGKVTDREQAVETLRELGGKIREVRQMVGEPGQALREAIRAYRETRRQEAAGPQ